MKPSSFVLSSGLCSFLPAKASEAASIASARVGGNDVCLDDQRVERGLERRFSLIEFSGIYRRSYCLDRRGISRQRDLGYMNVGFAGQVLNQQPGMLNFFSRQIVLGLLHDRFHRFGRCVEIDQ